jgi:hypothetical protein
MNIKKAWFLMSGRGDVSDYQSRVTAAGGTLSANDLTYLNTFAGEIAQIRSKIKDLGLFMGGFAGCFVKYIYADPLYKSMLNTSFVSGDYGETTGLTSLITTKKANTQIRRLALVSLWGIINRLAMRHSCFINKT